MKKYKSLRNLFYNYNWTILTKGTILNAYCKKCQTIQLHRVTDILKHDNNDIFELSCMNHNHSTQEAKRIVEKH